MYMEELADYLSKKAGNSADGGGAANVEPDGDITDMVKAETVILPP